MAGKRKTKKPVEQSKLLQAMEFLMLCQKSEGAEQLTHCIIADHRAMAYNGIIGIGQSIDEDLIACPQTEAMALALSRCGSSFAITQLAQDRLLVRSGDFEAFVPCCDRMKLSTVEPDAPAAIISDALKDALRVCAPLASDKAEHILAASIEVRSGSVLATDREVLIEAWHGHDLPSMLLPKCAATAIIKSGRTLTKFGYGGNTATFWFEDDSWIKTRLYTEKFESVRGMLDVPTNPRALPKAFFEAVKKIAPFSADGKVYCGQGAVSSHNIHYPAQSGSQLTLEIENGFVNRIYDIKRLKLIEKYADYVDENANPKATYFFTGNIRGAIFHSVLEHPIEVRYPTQPCPKCNGTYTLPDGSECPCLPF